MLMVTWCRSEFCVQLEVSKAWEWDCWDVCKWEKILLWNTNAPFDSLTLTQQCTAFPYLWIWCGVDVHHRCPPTRSTPARSTPTKSTPTRSTPTRSTRTRSTPTRSTSHQINFPPDQLPQGLLPPDQLLTRSTHMRSTPTRSTSHQINSHEVKFH